MLKCRQRSSLRRLERTSAILTDLIYREARRQEPNETQECLLCCTYMMHQKDGMRAVNVCCNSAKCSGECSLRQDSQFRKPYSTATDWLNVTHQNKRRLETQTMVYNPLAAVSSKQNLMLRTTPILPCASFKWLKITSAQLASGYVTASLWSNALFDRETIKMHSHTLVHPSKHHRLHLK